MRRRRSLLLAVATLGAALLGGCSDDRATGGTDTPSTTAADTPVTICEPTDVQAVDAFPLVHEIAAGLDAVEAELGSGVEYFEVNATGTAVNLFVALNNATIAQQYLWVDGELTATEGQEASGGTFTREQLEFDPDTVFSTIRTELPDTILESFYVNGDGEGLVKYAVLAVAQCGGGLDIVVGPDGAILSVEPL